MSLLIFTELSVSFDVNLPAEIRVPEDENVVLTVTLSKDKPVTWYKDDTHLALDDSRYQFTSVDTTHTLTILHAELGDQATYSIIADGSKAQTSVIVEGITIIYIILSYLPIFIRSKQLCLNILCLSFL